MNGVLAKILKLEVLVAGLFYGLAAGILVIDVVSREIFGQSIWGAQRMAVLLANGAALIGIGVAVGLGRHIRPPLLDFIVKDSYLPYVQRIGHFISSLVCFIGAYYASLLVLSNKQMGFTAVPLDLQIWVAQTALIYGLASSGMRYLIFMLRPALAPVDDASKT